ncbi:hypothetical protein ABK040_015687 [Willaertia magna]
MSLSHSPSSVSSSIVFEGDDDFESNSLFEYKYHPTKYDNILRSTKSSSSLRSSISNQSDLSLKELEFKKNKKKKETMEALSEEELRKKLFKKYKDKGVINVLKTQLRTMIYDDLSKSKNKNEEINNTPSDICINPFGNRPMFERVSDSIILDHLRKNNFNYTTSVFTSEAKITETFSEFDVFQMFGIKIYNLETIKNYDSVALEDINMYNYVVQQFSSMYYSKNWKGETILGKMITVLKNFSEKKCRNEFCQTEEGEEVQIDNKLRQLDEEYLSRIESEKKNSLQSLEQRYLEYQRECEKRANEELQMRLKMFEETTVSAMRLEESSRYREKLAKAREDLEKSYMRKMERLSAREKEVMERLERKEKELDKNSFEHRQRMLKEVEDLQRKEIAFQKEKSLIESKRQELEEKAKKLDKVMAQTTLDVKAEMSLMRSNLEKENIDNLRRIEEKRKEIEYEKEKVTELLKKHSDIKFLEETNLQSQCTIDHLRKELTEIRKRNRELEEMYEQSRIQQEKLNLKENSDNSDTSKESLLQREIDDLRDRLRKKDLEIDSITERLSLSEKKEKSLQYHLDLLKEEREKFIEQCKREVVEEKQKVKKIIANFQNNDKSLFKEKLRKEQFKTERIQRDLEEQYLNNRILSHEVDRLQHLLEQTKVMSYAGTPLIQTPPTTDLNFISPKLSLNLPSSLTANFENEFKFDLSNKYLKEDNVVDDELCKDVYSQPKEKSLLGFKDNNKQDTFRNDYLEFNKEKSFSLVDSPKTPQRQVQQVIPQQHYLNTEPTVTQNELNSNLIINTVPLVNPPIQTQTIKEIVNIKEKVNVVDAPPVLPVVSQNNTIVEQKPLGIVEERKEENSNIIKNTVETRSEEVEDVQHTENETKDNLKSETVVVAEKESPKLEPTKTNEENTAIPHDISPILNNEEVIQESHSPSIKEHEDTSFHNDDIPPTEDDNNFIQYHDQNSGFNQSDDSFLEGGFEDDEIDSDTDILAASNYDEFDF